MKSEVENNGDLYIQYQTAVDRKRQLDAWTMGPHWSGVARANTSTVDLGTLVINIYDPAKKQLVWRGRVSKTLNVKIPIRTIRISKRRLQRCSNYPPRSKK